MKAKHYTPAPHGVRISSLVWIILYATILASTGIVYCYLSNEKTRAARHTFDVENLTTMNQNDANIADLKINDELGYFEISNKLKTSNSPLAPLSHGQVEVIKESILLRARSEFASNESFFRR